MTQILLHEDKQLPEGTPLCLGGRAEFGKGQYCGHVAAWVGANTHRIRLSTGEEQTFMLSAKDKKDPRVMPPEESESGLLPCGTYLPPPPPLPV